MVEYTKIRFAGHAAHMGKNRNGYRTAVRKPK
jgi:hypothetical protein